MGISWREDLALGVEAIDSQHKELLARFDMLLASCKQGKGSQEVLQRESGYPGYEDHHREHEGFIARLADLKQRMHSDEGVQIDLVLDTNKLLLDWLIRHISVRDREVGRHLRSLGRA